MTHRIMKHAALLSIGLLALVSSGCTEIVYDLPMDVTVDAGIGVEIIPCIALLGRTGQLVSEVVWCDAGAALERKENGRGFTTVWQIDEENDPRVRPDWARGDGNYQFTPFLLVEGVLYRPLRSWFEDRELGRTSMSLFLLDADHEADGLRYEVH
jgi:hypothetical protein